MYYQPNSCTTHGRAWMGWRNLSKTAEKIGPPAQAQRVYLEEPINLEEPIRLPRPNQINFSICLSVCLSVCLNKKGIDFYCRNEDRYAMTFGGGYGVCWLGLRRERVVCQSSGLPSLPTRAPPPLGSWLLNLKDLWNHTFVSHNFHPPDAPPVWKR